MSMRDPMPGATDPAKERGGVFPGLRRTLGGFVADMTSERPVSQAVLYNQFIQNGKFKGKWIEPQIHPQIDISAQQPQMPSFVAGIVLSCKGPNDANVTPKEQLLVLDVRGLKKVGNVDLGKDTHFVVISPSLFGTDVDNPYSGLAEFSDGGIEIGRGLTGFEFPQTVSRNHVTIGELNQAAGAPTSELMVSDFREENGSESQPLNGTWITEDPSFSNAWKRVNPALNFIPTVIEAQ